MDRRQLLRALPFAGAAAVLPVAAFAIEINNGGSATALASLIDAHKAACAQYDAAVVVHAANEEAYKTDREKRWPMSVMPHIGKADIVVLGPGNIARSYADAAVRLKAKGIDPDAALKQALANYEAAWRIEDKHQQAHGWVASGEALDDAFEAMDETLLAICAFQPQTPADLATRAEYLLATLPKAMLQSGSGTYIAKAINALCGVA